MPPSSNRKRVKIQNPAPRSGPPMSGQFAVWFGSPFVIVGTLLLLIAFDFIQVADASFTSGRVPVVAFALLFVGLGSYLVVAGIQWVRQGRRVADAKARTPNEPWHWDYSWDRYGSGDGSARAVGSAIVSFVLVALFAVMFDTVMLDTRTPIRIVSTFPFVEAPHPELRWYAYIPLVFLALLNLLLIWLVWNLFAKLIHALKYRGGRVRFEQFPYFVGDRVQFTLVLPQKEFESVRAELRCVEEAIVVTETPSGNQTGMESFQIFSAQLDIPNGTAITSGAAEMVLRFDLPSDVPGTQFSDRPYTYWELVVSGAASGLDYTGEFLIPVYSRRGAIEHI